MPNAWSKILTDVFGTYKKKMGEDLKLSHVMQVLGPHYRKANEAWNAKGKGQPITMDFFREFLQENKVDLGAELRKRIGGPQAGGGLWDGFKSPPSEEKQDPPPANDASQQQQPQQQPPQQQPQQQPQQPQQQQPQQPQQQPQQNGQQQNPNNNNSREMNDLRSVVGELRSIVNQMKEFMREFGPQKQQ